MSLTVINEVATVETHIDDDVVIAEMAEGETLDRTKAQQAVEDGYRYGRLRWIGIHPCIYSDYRSYGSFMTRRMGSECLLFTVP